MKVFGWILIVLAAFNFIVFIGALSIGRAEDASTQISAALMFGVLGAYLVHRAKQKKQEQIDRDEWNK